jgi:hypothetical protein
MHDKKGEARFGANLCMYLHMYVFALNGHITYPHHYMYVSCMTILAFLNTTSKKLFPDVKKQCCKCVSELQKISFKFKTLLPVFSRFVLLCISLQCRTKNPFEVLNDKRRKQK